MSFTSLLVVTLTALIATQAQLLPSSMYGSLIGNATGRGVRVAILDDGLYPLQSTIANVRKIVSWVGVQPGHAPRRVFPGDQCRHGTTVANIIAGSNSLCPGLAPDALIYSHRVYEDSGHTFSQWMMNACEDAYEDGVDVINLSFGGFESPVDKAFVECLQKHVDRGAIVVAAAGTKGRRSSAQLVQGAILVSALSDRSVYDDTDWRSVYVASDDIMSSELTSACAMHSGVSMSTAVVSGIVAALLETQPRMTVSQIMTRLKTVTVPTPV